jgi:hypothetical protein
VPLSPNKPEPLEIPESFQKEVDAMKRLILGGFLALFFSTMVCAQEKIEAPAWNAGDKWDFGQEGFLEVVGIEKNGLVAKFSAGIFPRSTRGTVIFDKSTFNVLSFLEGDKVKKYRGAHRRILNFPLAVGKKWNDEFKRISPDGFHGADVAETIKVLGWEEVAVPAGKCKAIKLEYQINYGPPGLGPIYESKAWYWYSPEVKYLVKGRYGKDYNEAVVPLDASFKGGREDWKLISFKLKK